MKKKLKNRMAQLLTALLAVAVIGAFTPQVSMPAYAADGDPAMVLGSESVLKSTVNAPNAQTVWYADNDWRVIGYDGVGAWDKLDSITLLSARNIGDITEFKAHYNHDEYSEHDMDYAGSFLRERIEGTEETPGILDSFSKPEQAAMVERDLLVQKYAAIGTDGVYETEMNNVLLWPLSTREAMVVNEALRIIDPEHTDILERNYCWWLRSPGNPTNNTFKRIRAAFVRSDGSVGLEGTDVDLDAGVRPAFYLNKNAVFFTSAAEGGKDSGTAGENALKAVGKEIGSIAIRPVSYSAQLTSTKSIPAASASSRW